MSDHKRIDARDERGAALILVLFLVVIFGIVIAAIMGFADTGALSTQRITEVRNLQHAVDGATDAAIDSIRNSNRLGTFGQNVPDQSTCGAPPDRPFSIEPVQDSSDEVTVHCRLDQTTVPDQPLWAVHTLGEGFVADGAAVTVAGGLFSHGVVTSADRLTVVGDLRAGTGACDTMQVTGDKICTPGAASDPAGSDPGYPPATDDPAAAAAPLLGSVDPLPTCVNDDLVRFVPGLYSERPRDLLDASPTTLTCRAARNWWFDAGEPDNAYYFDFRDGQAAWDLSGLDSVVGGSRTPSGACDPNAPGVQFIFGGESRVTWSSSTRVELCSNPSAVTEQRISVYGLPSGSRAPAPAATIQATVASSPSNRFVNPTNALSQGGGTSTGSFSGDGPEEGRLDVSSWPIPKIPPGSTIESATFRVLYSTSGSHPWKANVDLSFDPGDGSTVTCPLGGSIPGGRTCDLEGVLPAPFLYRSLNDITSATVDVHAESLENHIDAVVCPDPPGGCVEQDFVPAETATVSVDAIVLDVSYTPPGFEEHDCPLSAPDCALIEVTGSSDDHPTILIRGTVYAPTAKIDVHVRTMDKTLFGRGVIARHLVAHVDSASTWADAPFQVIPSSTPTGTPLVQRQVIFTASVDGVPKLRARVRYVDATPAGVGHPGYRAEVLDWAVLR